MKGVKSQCFIIESGVSVVSCPLDSSMCVYGCNDERGENGDGEDGSEVSGGGKRVRLPSLLYVEDLAMCGESEEDLKVMVG